MFTLCSTVQKAVPGRAANECDAAPTVNRSVIHPIWVTHLWINSNPSAGVGLIVNYRNKMQT